MGVEIERKFLLRGGFSWQEVVGEGAGQKILQGYVMSDERTSVRVRTKGERAFLTIKASRGVLTRAEFEYEIPWEDAEQLIEQVCEAGRVVKTRYVVERGGKEWEVDVFEGENAGLVVAEIELGSEDEEFERPEWLGEEVSDDARYLNANLALRPVSGW